MVTGVVAEGDHVPGGERAAAAVASRHEEVHLHILSRSGDTLFRRVIRGPQDVDLGWDEGVTALTDDWDEHERRWTSGC